MPYYMTFFVDHADKVDFGEIEDGLRAEDPAYRIDVLERYATDPFDAADLYHDHEVYARIEINQPGDPLFHSEVQEFSEAVQYGGRGQTSRVIKILRRARVIVRVHVLWRERDPELILRKLEPLWEWLFVFRSGVLHADGEGYYDADGLIVEFE